MFNKDKTGELVIGASPHEVKPENYLEINLSMTQDKLVNDVMYFFGKLDLLQFI